jgi:glutamyl-Q tRNA(Asp) synthetase
MSSIFRFAPSPNGYLHLGHAFSALFTAEAAAAMDGVMLLRIEDIDRERCKPEYDAALIEDLHWLGLDWPEPVMRQSRRFEAYFEAARDLRARDLLYPCFCSRNDIALRATRTDPDGGPLYPGTCRHLTDTQVAERIVAGKQPQYRLDMAAALKITGDLMVNEPVLHGDRFLAGARRAAHPEYWGDVVIVRKDVPTSYHLAVVVDDAAQGVTHVTRGRDLYHATDIHVVLQRLLGLPSPLYLHHELVMTEAGDEKLSKSRGSPSLRSLREQGWTPADVRRHLGFEAEPAS